MGNPLDLGFTIVEGTYNGFVEKSYNARMHFTGAINPGMSGGPAVTAAGKVAGINVAKRLDGELVELPRAGRQGRRRCSSVRKTEPPLDLAHVRDEIDRQLVLVAGAISITRSASRAFAAATLGPYEAPESAAPWFNCWARTNADQTPKPRAQLDSTSCSSQSSLFIAEDIETGRSRAFARVRAQRRSQSVPVRRVRLAVLRRRRHDPLVVAKATDAARMPRGFRRARRGRKGESPVLRTVWCARAYRDFAGIYDVAITTVTQDRDKEALVSRLAMQGVSYDNAITLAQRFVGELAWAK